MECQDPSGGLGSGTAFGVVLLCESTRSQFPDESHEWTAAEFVFFSSASPPDAVVAAAEEELGRLVVPSCPADIVAAGGADLGAAVTFVRSWLTSHYDPRRPQAWRARSLRPGLRRRHPPHRALIESACSSDRWRRTVEVDVTLAPGARVNTGPGPLEFFIAKTLSGWELWHQG